MSIAEVIHNDKEAQEIRAHVYKSTWSTGFISHHKQYRDRRDGSLTSTPTEEVGEVLVGYSQLVRVVELYQDGRLHNGDASVLRQGNWTYKLDDDEVVRAISAACVMEDQMLSMQGVHSIMEDDDLDVKGKVKIYDVRGFQKKLSNRLHLKDFFGPMEEPVQEIILVEWVNEKV